jgi:hypothetical protein
MNETPHTRTRIEVMFQPPLLTVDPYGGRRMMRAIKQRQKTLCKQLPRYVEQARQQEMRLRVDDPPRVLRMRRLLERLCYDDALEYQWMLRGRRKKMRIEYLHLNKGFPHFRVYAGRRLIGAVYIRHQNVYTRETQLLAEHLVDIGVEPLKVLLQERGAATSMSAPMRDLPRFWWDEERLAKNRERQRKRRTTRVNAPTAI